LQAEAMNKVCPRCGVDKNAGEFGRNKTQRDGFSVYCKECARSIANEHYRKKRAAAGFEVREKDTSPEGFKRCTHCRSVLPLDRFHRHNTFSDGYNIYCKDCRREKGAATHLKRTYGITRFELDALIAAQGGLCAICQTKPAAHVDHDHVTGKIRGVLCFTCNVALGQLKDDAALFRKAIDYLERTTWQKTLECPGVYRLTSPRPAAAASSTSSTLLRRTSSRPA
jgi:hypothetical protein